MAEKRFPVHGNLGAWTDLNFTWDPQHWRDCCVVQALIWAGIRESSSALIVTLKVTSHKGISEIFILEHWFNLWTFWCGTQPPSVSFYFPFASIFIRCSPVNIFHWDLTPQSKWEMFVSKSDPCKGIAILKNSIPVKLFEEGHKSSSTWFSIWVSMARGESGLRLRHSLIAGNNKVILVSWKVSERFQEWIFMSCLESPSILKKEENKEEELVPYCCAVQGAF